MQAAAPTQLSLSNIPSNFWDRRFLRFFLLVLRQYLRVTCGASETCWRALPVSCLGGELSFQLNVSSTCGRRGPDLLRLRRHGPLRTWKHLRTIFSRPSTFSIYRGSTVGATYRSPFGFRRQIETGDKDSFQLFVNILVHWLLTFHPCFCQWLRRYIFLLRYKSSCLIWNFSKP